jgi:hypothetical protein
MVFWYGRCKDKLKMDTGEVDFEDKVLVELAQDHTL